MPADKNVRAIVGTVPLIVITGHYGVGKTNLALNLARDLRAVYPRVTLVDLDIVNPYFRSSDSRAFLAQHDIALLGPSHAGGNLDTPSLAPGIDTAIETASASHAVVVDVGGDPDGARALGRFASSFMVGEHGRGGDRGTAGDRRTVPLSPPLSPSASEQVLASSSGFTTT